MVPTGWSNLLTGAEAVIADRWLRHLTEQSAARLARTEDASYASGYAGLALLFGYLSVEHGSDREARRAKETLDLAIALVESTAMGVDLFHGCTGVAWTIHHLDALWGNAADPAATQEIDELLLDLTAQSPWPGSFDLMAGLAGFGCYAADHPDRRIGAELAHRVVHRLEELAETREAGLVWRTPRELLNAELADRYPAGHCDAGMAHGSPGVIGCLARLLEKGYVPDAADLLRKAVDGLLGMRRTGRSGSRYPWYADQQAASCRSAWCRGDPGVAASLTVAAHTLHVRHWQDEAIETLIADSKREPRERQVTDMSLCHGQAGLAHIARRVFHATGDRSVGAVARLELTRLLRALDETSSEPRESVMEIPETQDDPSLLTGDLGIALTLLAERGKLAPDWDKPLLLPGWTCPVSVDRQRTTAKYWKPGQVGT